MKTIVYKKTYHTAPDIDNFLDIYFSLQMPHMASDLLEMGLSPEQISNAVAIAIKIANSSSIDTRKHFRPFYSVMNQEIIKDCKLSHLGYGLVFMNADRNLSAVADFQVNILKEYLKMNV